MTIITNKVLCLPTELLQSDGKILKLKHPKELKPVVVYYNSDNKQIHELFSLKEKHQSWFVDNTVLSSNELIIGMPIDPLFFILTYLSDKPTHFVPVGHLLVDEEYPSSCYLEDLVSNEHLSNIADIKPELGKVIKFNKQKTLTWLSKKLESVVDVMKESKINPGFNSELKDTDYLLYVCGIICDYINPSLASDFRDKLGINIEEVEEEKPAKRQKLSTDNENPEPFSKENSITNTSKKNPKTVKSSAVKSQKLTKGQKQLAYVSTKGMKSMSSFFSKK